MLIARRRIGSRGTAEAWLRMPVDGSAVVIRDTTPEVAALATHMPEDFPADPADRLIAATARADGVALVTRDTWMRASPVVETIW